MTTTNLSIQELKDQVLCHEYLTGLVSPDGIFYECPDYNHDGLMCTLFGKEYTNSQFVGWLHIGMAAGLYLFEKRTDYVIPTHNNNSLSWAQGKLLDAILECEIPVSLQTEIYYFLS